MAKLLHLSRPSKRVGNAVQAWWAMRSQKRRRKARTEAVETPLPQLVHQPHAGFPNTPLYDDIYLADNPGALASDSVEVWVLDPSQVIILGNPNPTEADWQLASIGMASYDAGVGRWVYVNAGVGETKKDGDSAWIRARFHRAGQVGPWSVVDGNSGTGVATWSYG